MVLADVLERFKHAFSDKVALEDFVSAARKNGNKLEIELTPDYLRISAGKLCASIHRDYYDNAPTSGQLRAYYKDFTQYFEKQSLNVVKK